jgi:type II secretory pathway component PulF
LTNFNYKARDRYGVLLSGEVEASDTKAAARQLEKMGYTPISLSEVQASIFSQGLENLLSAFQTISPQEMIVLTRQLASVLEAGVPLVDGLDAVSEQIRNRRFQEIVRQVKKDIGSGLTFSGALDKHRKVFPSLIISMVRAGESAGILPEVLDRISNLLDKEYETINKIKSATRYPMIVLITLSVAFVVMTVYVIPRFSAFFAAFKADLPLPTRILIAFNHYVSSYWFIVLIVLLAAVYLFRKILETERGRYGWDRFILSTPVFGALFSKINLSRFGYMLSAMLASGIPILEALTITSATVDNKVIAKVIIDIRNKVSQGKSLAEPMRGSKIFPPIAISMVAIGEKAGTLEGMLEKVAGYFDREADYTIRNLTPLLEPLLIFGLGMILLLFALGIFLPMWDIVNIVK